MTNNFKKEIRQNTKATAKENKDHLDLSINAYFTIGSYDYSDFKGVPLPFLCENVRNNNLTSSFHNDNHSSIAYNLKQLFKTDTQDLYLFLSNLLNHTVQIIESKHFKGIIAPHIPHKDKEEIQIYLNEKYPLNVDLQTEKSLLKDRNVITPELNEWEYNQEKKKLLEELETNKQHKQFTKSMSNKPNPLSEVFFNAYSKNRNAKENINSNIYKEYLYFKELQTHDYTTLKTELDDAKILNLSTKYEFNLYNSFANPHYHILSTIRIKKDKDKATAPQKKITNILEIIKRVLQFVTSTLHLFHPTHYISKKTKKLTKRKTINTNLSQLDKYIFTKFTNDKKLPEFILNTGNHILINATSNNGYINGGKENSKKGLLIDVHSDKIRNLIKEHLKTFINQELKRVANFDSTRTNHEPKYLAFIKTKREKISEIMVNNFIKNIYTNKDHTKRKNINIAGYTLDFYEKNNTYSQDNKKTKVVAIAKKKRYNLSKQSNSIITYKEANLKFRNTFKDHKSRAIMLRLKISIGSMILTAYSNTDENGNIIDSTKPQNSIKNITLDTQREIISYITRPSSKTQDNNPNATYTKASIFSIPNLEKETDLYYLCETVLYQFINKSIESLLYNSIGLKRSIGSLKYLWEYKNPYVIEKKDINKDNKNNKLLENYYDNQ